MARPKKKLKKGEQPPRRFRGCAVLLVLIAILIAAGYGAFWYLSKPVDRDSRQAALIAIPKGANARSIGRMLEADGIIRNRRIFALTVMLEDANGSLHPGTYRLSPAMTPKDIVAILVAGKTASQDIVIPPGFTLRQIADRLAAAQLTDRDDFLREAQTDGRGIHADHGFTPPDDSLEGYLYPDTYRISPGLPPRMILGEMVSNFEKHVVLTHPNVTSWREPINIASMIEREAKVPDDQPKIAGVITNRLRVGMDLDIDATIEYVLPEHKARLMLSDYKFPSPFNTYRHKGLPPTPICSPGQGAIEAALDPEKSDYLYYFAGPGGRHIFTKSLAEHDAVIRRVRAGLQSD